MAAWYVGIGIDVRRSRSELGSFVSRAFVDGFETGLRANTIVRVTWQNIAFASRGSGWLLLFMSHARRGASACGMGALLVVFERRFWFIWRYARFARASFIMYVSEQRQTVSIRTPLWRAPLLRQRRYSSLRYCPLHRSQLRLPLRVSCRSVFSRSPQGLRVSVCALGCLPAPGR